MSQVRLDIRELDPASDVRVGVQIVDAISTRLGLPMPAPTKVFDSERYEIERIGSDLNDHAVHFQLVTTLAPRKSRNPITAIGTVKSTSRRHSLTSPNLHYWPSTPANC
jgi:hypothetical protein